MRIGYAHLAVLVEKELHEREHQFQRRFQSNDPDVSNAVAIYVRRRMSPQRARY
jgi:hypothetical protein